MNAPADPPYLGLVHDLANADYHAAAALGSSGLRKLAKSPLHYFAGALDPDRPLQATSPAMAAGTLCHCHVLEPHAVAERYVIKPAGHDGRTKEGKAWLERTPAHLEVVSAEQMRTAERQAAAVRQLPEIAALLADGKPEVSAFWVDETTGELCKCRPDWVSPAGDGVVLLDLKTTVSATPKDFARSVVNFGYAMQAAHYCDGYEKASGKAVLGMVFVCVESDYPHAATAYMLPDEWLSMAQAQRAKLMATYAECKRTSSWPGYSQTIQPLEMPRWLAGLDT